jgi:RNA polymerase sigma-70 factor (ECF subfamily)
MQHLRRSTSGTLTDESQKPSDTEKSSTQEPVAIGGDATTLEADFVVAYEQHADAIFRHCFFRIHHRERAQELMQDTFAKTWKYLAKGKTVLNIRAFLYKTANNLVIDEVRQKKRRPTSSLDELQEQGFDVGNDDDAEAMKQHIDAQKIMEVLKEVKQPYQDVLIMRHIDGLSPAEIAEIKGESANVISVRINRAEKQLRSLLPDD